MFVRIRTPGRAKLDFELLEESSSLLAGLMASLRLSGGPSENPTVRDADSFQVPLRFPRGHWLRGGLPVDLQFFLPEVRQNGRPDAARGRVRVGLDAVRCAASISGRRRRPGR